MSRPRAPRQGEAGPRGGRGRPPGGYPSESTEARRARGDTHVQAWLKPPAYAALCRLVARYGTQVEAISQALLALDRKS